MKPVEVRQRLVDLFRRDLVGPGPEDADLATERLKEKESPSRWYLTGYLAPVDDPQAMAAPAGDSTADLFPEENEPEADEPDVDGAGGAAGDDEQPETPSARRRYLPTSIGLTVMLDPGVTEIEAFVTWGDYRTEPPLDAVLLAPDPPGEREAKPKRPDVQWVRRGQQRTVRVPIVDGRGSRIVVPESAPQQRAGGGLELETHARLFDQPTPDGGSERVRVVTVFLVNRRANAHRRYADIAYAFQARLELRTAGLRPRRDLSALRTEDWDLRVADLHYRDVEEWAVGRNVAAAWDQAEDAAEKVTRVWTDPLPLAEVERIAPNEDADLTAAITFAMETLAEKAADGATLRAALAALPGAYGSWIDGERLKLVRLSPARRATAGRLIGEMETARGRIEAGIDVLAGDAIARRAFQLMNLAVARAARRRNAGAAGDPAAQAAPTWRPFQLAFILLNLSGLVDRAHRDRETADLLFFPTGGGKTEAYLGLAAFVIARRRLAASGVLGAGVAVIMRYTLRLLTLDQLARAAGVVCALELLRTDPANRDARGKAELGEWPIEIGLWVGSDASPNLLGKTGDGKENTAVARVRRYRNGRDRRAPAPIKACPWCGTPFTPASFSCVPNDVAPRNLEIRCANTACDFTRDRPLPILTVDEPIYRRLPSFLIATVDKFASLPWEGKTGAFFGHVDRFGEGDGFYGAAEPGIGQPLYNGASLDPPELIIQDELHLISGPLGTVSGLYETAIDRLASRHHDGGRVRPKIVASTATVRRASDQIRALFDRPRTAIFPPPGIDRIDSFFARTVSSSKDPARWYLGIAAQGRGPKLVFLRALTSLLSAAQAAFEQKVERGKDEDHPADPFMTAVCYFNALRELGGARRIVEDEVRDRVGRYGSERFRIEPPARPFADRKLREPMELTSRVSTDDVAAAKSRLENPFGRSDKTIDVALATNMISVGLDIQRLGLMLVQGQPKTAAEYIQATSRVGRDHRRPGLVVAVLNLHKPRDRLHFEQFGHFHRSFYRAVEATSVTPWAARALDRALAAVVVAAARHLDPALTPEGAVTALRESDATRKAVRDAIVARAPEAAVPGGRAALGAQVDDLMTAWIATSDAQTAAGTAFRYAASKSPQRLLHMPLAPELPNLTEDHRRFVAGRSMRDVEQSVTLEVKDPWGRQIANADDI